MRTTIHMVSGREFWRYAIGVRQARRTWALRAPARRRGHEADVVAKAERIRAALADGPRTVKELGELGAGFVGNLGLWVDLVRVPPSGTWERRRADRLALAEDWVGPYDATEDGGPRAPRARLPARVRARRRGATSRRGPGIPVDDAKRGGDGLDPRPLPRRGRARADRPARRAPARPGDTGARALPAALGREPARPRAADRAPARAVPAAGLQHAQPVLGRHRTSSTDGWSARGRSGTAGSCSIRTRRSAPRTARDRAGTRRPRGVPDGSRTFTAIGGS